MNFLLKGWEAAAQNFTPAIISQYMVAPHASLVWRASPFTREEGSGVMPIRKLFPRSQECDPIRLLHVMFDLMGLSLACVLTNQMLDLYIH